jgi:single-stranded-DNA-specific exonuclease
MLSKKDSDNDRNNANNIDFGQSVRGLNWILNEADERTLLTLCQKANLDEILARILINRNIDTIEEVNRFLDPKLKNSMPDPSNLIDMDKATERILQAFEKGEKITVFGDYDVDGATSSALLRKFFSELGIEHETYIPNRLTEGYGPSAEAFEKIKQNGSKLVVTVDCGTVSFEPLQAAKDMGLDVVVIDHHLGVEELPAAVAVVNPNRLDETFEYKTMAAVGVVFMVLISLSRKLENHGWFEKKGVDPINLIKYLDLVALGTVCDVMPLTGINRAFVTQGLKLIKSRQNIGLATLSQIVNMDTQPQCHHLGYVFGPRINAGGRVGMGILGSDLLTTSDPVKAYKLAMRLEQYNEERKSIEALALEEAYNQIEEKRLYENPVLLAVGRDWHVGILGILASRIKERYNKPTAVVSLSEDGLGKGSARSIPGIDMGTAISIAKADGLLLEGGGHAMAGGFTVQEERIEELYTYFIKRFENAHDSLERANDLDIDALISIQAVNRSMMDKIEMAAPYGNGNPQPRFLVPNVYIVRVNVVGGNHIMVIVSSKPVDQYGFTAKCMLFKGVDTELGDFLMNNLGKKISLVGTLQANSWDRNKIDLIIEDAAY